MAACSMPMTCTLMTAASADQQNPKPMQESGRTASTGRGERGDSVFIREYSNNKLLREDAISAEELDAVFGPFERRQERRQKRRIRTKRVRRVFPRNDNGAVLHLFSHDRPIV